tara:strand:+ start:183 stop:803 length:621 start_codon:yes stop_codon:yes gene_type:complete
MKTFAIAALFGLISAKDTTGVWQLKSVLSHRDEQVLQNYYGDVSTARANARPPMRSHIELDSDSGSSDDESDDETNVQFVPGDEQKGVYERKIPARFEADSDDLFMRSMLTAYCTEEETEEDKKTGYKGGEPTGVFTMTEAQSKAAATEVLGTHKGLTGAAAEAYLQTYWSKAWGHFDVNRTGKIAVYRTPELMRFLASDQYMSLG